MGERGKRERERGSNSFYCCDIFYGSYMHLFARMVTYTRAYRLRGIFKLGGQTAGIGVSTGRRRWEKRNSSLDRRTVRCEAKQIIK